MIKTFTLGCSAAVSTNLCEWRGSKAVELIINIRWEDPRPGGKSVFWGRLFLTRSVWSDIHWVDGEIKALISDIARIAHWRPGPEEHDRLVAQSLAVFGETVPEEFLSRGRTRRLFPRDRQIVEIASRIEDITPKEHQRRVGAWLLGVPDVRVNRPENRKGRARR